MFLLNGVYKQIYKAAIFAAVCIMLIGCSPVKDGKKTIVVTIPPLQTIVQEIAGDSIEVKSIMNKSADPEQFEPLLKDVKLVADADAYFTIGYLPVETNLIKKLSNSADAPKQYDLSRNIKYIRGTHSHEHHGDHEDNEHHNEGEVDPHVWSSFPNMRIIAKNAFEYLCEISPENTDYFRANYISLDERIDSLGRLTEERLRPYADKSFLVMHPSLSYFAHDYDLVQIPVGSENKELSIIGLIEAIEDAKHHQSKLIVLNVDAEGRGSENIINELDINHTIYNPVAPQWENELERLTDAIITTYNNAR